MIKIIIIAIGFNCFDFLTGFIVAVKNKNIKSSKMRDGLFKKIGFILCYILAYGLSYTNGYLPIPISDKLLIGVCGYVILTEIVSIVENLYNINDKLIPTKLFELFGFNKGD